jgi:hypothetical protein
LLQSKPGASIDFAAMRRRLWPLALALALLGTLSCLEPPVSETLDIEMRDDGASRVAVAVALRDPADYERVPKARERLRDEARALEQGTDAWSQRLRAASPTRERTTAERARGTLRRMEREVELEGPDDLAALMRDSGIGMSYTQGEGWAELTLVPGASRRASSAQRQLVRAELERFSDTAAAYIAAVAELYRYLDSHSERSRACLGAIVSEVPEGDSLTRDEEALVDAVNEGIGAIGSVLDVAPGDGLTLDEMSALVYDPTRITVPGKILERDGFPGSFDAALSIPRFSLWSAYARLSGRWLAPDLALELWRHDADAGETPIELDVLAAMPRYVVSVPGAAELRRAVELDLTPAPAYVVRWARAD